MAGLKTKKTAVSVSAFLNAVANEQVRKDAKVVAGIMQKVTKAKPAMWGTNIVGFGKLTYKYPDGREMDWMITAFAPRTNNITLYVLGDFKECDPLLTKLGKHSRGGSCLHIKRLSDVDMPTLTKLVEASVKHNLKTHAPA